MLVLHANWTNGSLVLWAEVPALIPPLPPAPPAPTPPPPDPAGAPAHAFAADAADLLRAIHPALPSSCTPRETSLTLTLPAAAGAPAPSPRAAHAAGRGTADGDDEDLPGDPLHLLSLASLAVPALRIDPEHAPAVLESLEDLAQSSPEEFAAADDVRFFAAVARLVRHLLAQQRLVPALMQDPSGMTAGIWQPWLADEPTAVRVRRLADSMPPSARAVAGEHDPWTVIDDALTRMTDAACRAAFITEELDDALEGRDPTDPHVAWLRGLLGEKRDAEFPFSQRSRSVARVRGWIGGLEDRGVGSEWRLLLKLDEPLDVTDLHEFSSPGDSVRWALTCHLQSVSDPHIVIDAADVWSLPAGAATVDGHRIESPQELLLKEIARAARIERKLERALASATPGETDLSTAEAYAFLRESMPLLVEQGFAVDRPDWWDSPTVRLGARLRIDSDPLESLTDLPEPRSSNVSPSARLGLNTLVSYTWQLAIGDTPLTMEQFEQLAAQRSPLVRVGGRWVEVRREDIRAALRFIHNNPGGQIEVAKALRLAYSSDPEDTGIQVLGMDATGWVATVFGDPGSNQTLPMIGPPRGLNGVLRPYQLKGLSWLAFLDRFGLGACLADDMGLGKTIQLLALVLHEREAWRDAGSPEHAVPGPTLVIAPMSVVPNWVREAEKFTPELRVIVHHGVERPSGPDLAFAAENADAVITTYALAHRDRADLEAVNWGRVVLDEAQNVKNPQAKQAQAVRAFRAPRRVALTGTPVENRLTELWSIMEFLNPGYLGPAAEFRRRLAIPIERYHDQLRGAQLRGLVQPFILRRLKSDPRVIEDLPEKVESKEYCYLTPEQAGLYERCVADMLTAAEHAEGIQRRGLVLAGLVRLKQICNHPAQLLKEAGVEGDLRGGPVPNPSRSGKTVRIIQMLEEVIAEGDQALVFTQFRQMGHLLAAMLRHHLDRETLFLHGGTPTAKRQELIERFQRADGSAPIFLLSLKAGGVGLNLTAANHVFHFDRWWNPAVESQATDRAYRIGQTRRVHVHKFVVAGTLEERIDQMIEDKMRLAEQVIGSGEEWLTELDTSQLRELLSLRPSAVAEEGE